MIIQVIPDYVRGGGELMARAIHRGVLERGYKSILAVITRKNVPLEEGIVSLNGRFPRDFTAYHNLRRLTAIYPEAIVHAHMHPAQVIAAMLSVGRHHLVTTEHSTYNRRRGVPGFRWLDAAMYARYGRIVAISPAVAFALSNWCPATADKITVIPNGVAVSTYRFSCENPQRVRFVSVGRLEYVKNFEMSIQAVARLLAEGNDVTYDIYGQGSLCRHLEQRIESMGYRDRIRLLGWTGELSGILADYTAAIIPSRWEGFGLVAVEAMAAGLPVICSDVSGLAEVVKGGPHRFFQKESLDDLVRTLKQILGEPGFLGSESRHAARRCAANWDIKRTIENHLQLYKALGARTPSGA